jgi:hypothetical protein
MHNFAAKGMETFNIRPLPSTQSTYSGEEYIGTVFEFVGFAVRILIRALDRQIPFSCGL